MKVRKISPMRRLAERGRNYGITAEQIVSQWSAQQGLCAICDADISLYSNGMNIDHDHRAGRVRGLLCPNCNRLVAVIDQSKVSVPVLAVKADEYVANGGCWKEALNTLETSTE